jgi:iron complex transport system permease protein
MNRTVLEAVGAARGHRGFRVSATLLSGFVLLVLALLALATGKYPISLADIADVLGHRLLGLPARAPATIDTVIMKVRLPRVVAALVVGAALSAAGATYQGLFRNLPVVPIQGLAFLGGLGAVAVVYGIGLAVRRQDPVLTLVLAGVAVGAALGAGISLLKVLADPYNQLPAITFWLLGSLSSVSLGDVGAILPMMLLGLAPLVLLRWRMNLMSLGDEEARALGVETRVLRPLLIAGATLITAAAVSMTGVIGWIGLIVPHVARLLVGPDYRRLLPASLALGAGYLLAVDLIARTAATIEVPLGILTALVGAPFFLWLLAAGRRRIA